MDSKSIGLCPQALESPRCRAFSARCQALLRTLVASQLVTKKSCWTPKSAGARLPGTHQGTLAIERSARDMRHHDSGPSWGERWPRVGANDAAATDTHAHTHTHMHGQPLGFTAAVQTTILVRNWERHDTVSERLRRWTRNPLGSARRGSNPLAVVFVSILLAVGVA